jgi:hypothetical protein
MTKQNARDQRLNQKRLRRDKKKREEEIAKWMWM